MDFLDNLEMPAWLAYTITAVIILAFVYWKFRDQIFFPFKHKKVKGVITNWMSMNEKGVRYFYPLIEYTTLEGRLVKFRAEERCEGEPMFDPGTEVEVQYIPGNAQLVKIKYPNR
jgi:hypothetical protein